MRIPEGCTWHVAFRLLRQLVWLPRAVIAARVQLRCITLPHTTCSPRTRRHPSAGDWADAALQGAGHLHLRPGGHARGVNVT